MMKTMTVSLLMVFPLLTMGDDSAVQNALIENQGESLEYAVIKDSSQAILDLWAESEQPSINAKVVNPEREKINALLGTWHFTYDQNGKAQSVKMVLDSSKEKDGTLAAIGTWYDGQNNFGTNVACLYSQSLALMGDYMCVKVPDFGTFYESVIFSFATNKVSRGVYGSGFGADSLGLNLVLSGKSVSGYREAYSSDFNLLQWNKRGDDNDYCLDIADDKGNLYPGLSPITCGRDLITFSPRDYVNNVMHGRLPNGFAFRWRVWSANRNAQNQTIGKPNYAGSGYEGRVVVQN